MREEADSCRSVSPIFKHRALPDPGKGYMVIHTHTHTQTQKKKMKRTKERTE